MTATARVVVCVFVSMAAALQPQAALALLPQPKALTPGSGSLAIPATSRIVSQGTGLEPLADILASDIARVHGVQLATGQAPPAAGDIVLRLVTDAPALLGTDAYRVTVDQGVRVEGRTYQAIAMGMMTVLQALQTDGGALTIERMAVADFADRAFRALQVSIRGGYHSPQWVKKVIDLMRFYKLRVLQLHTAEALWVGSVMDSSNAADPKLLKEHSAWSKREMEDVIAYASARGVSLVPHNEMRPNDPFWPVALTKDFNPADTFADYVDEIDGKGKYEIKGNLADDPRWWNFLKVASQRSRDQFAKSWPNGKLPYYHIGPVYGEGGCNGKEAVRMLGFLKENNPAIKMMYWNGPGDADPDLTPHKRDLVVDFYSATWGGTPDGLLAAGYTLCNTSWTPLYIQPGSRIKAQRQGKWIFDEFHLSRFGAEGPFGGPIQDHARDCPQAQDGIVGSLLSTWDFAGPDDREGHLEMIAPCIPFFAEHIWNVRPWPYPADAWPAAAAAAARLAPLANQFLREARPSSPPGSVTATDGVLPDAVEVLWAESDNYPEFYQVYRADADDSAKAQPVSDKIPAAFVTQLNSFRDTTVTPGKNCFYWVRSLNPLGASAFGQSAKGGTGAGALLPAASEAFDYPADAALDGLAGGTGFKTAWKVEEFNAPLTITAGGLTYPGLRTSGRALHVESTDADETNRRRPPHVVIHRELTNPYGQDGTQVWTSFLIQANKPEVGECLALIGRLPVGKGWGDGFTFGGGKMQANKPYLIVVRYTFHKGNDLAHMWLNPTPGKQPADTDAVAVSRQEENPGSDAYLIRMQPYGKGSYDIDEIRVGKSYAEVVPVQN